MRAQFGARQRAGLRRTRLGFAAALVGMLIGGAGCATPGPLHAYSVATGAETIRDRGTDAATEVSVPSFLAPGDELTGFAYDPFTDHFFLRLAPGNKIRVVDRPARAIKRELEIDAVAARAGGDVAVRPRDGHLFFITAGAELLETTRLGKFVRMLALAEIDARPAAVAFDMKDDVLLVLHSDHRRITRHALDGAARGELTLDRAVGQSLGFDADRREFYATLQDAPESAIGVFSETGKFLRTLPTRGQFVDVGPRSFVRVF